MKTKELSAHVCGQFLHLAAKSNSTGRMNMMDLNQCRAELDKLDAQLVGLFEKRMRIARNVALYKHEKNWEYCFYVDVTGRIDENTLRVLMESLSRDCEQCRLLGAYKAAKE